MQESLVADVELKRKLDKVKVAHRRHTKQIRREDGIIPAKQVEILLKGYFQRLQVSRRVG